MKVTEQRCPNSSDRLHSAHKAVPSCAPRQHKGTHKERCQPACVAHTWHTRGSGVREQNIHYSNHSKKQSGASQVQEVEAGASPEAQSLLSFGSASCSLASSC
eukprot:5903-Heterococcus_DN1.PRE.1